jgi:hypothetical protein
MDRFMGCPPRNRLFYRPLLEDVHEAVAVWERNLYYWRRRELALTILLIVGVAAGCVLIVCASARLEKPPYAPRYASSPTAVATLESRGAVFGYDPSGRITRVVVHSPGFQDADLVLLRGLPDLQTVLLVGTPVTDAGIRTLHTLPNLRSINLIDTRVTHAGSQALKAALPQASVRVGQTVDD